MLDFLTTLVSFLFALGVVILVHELGHFAVAKAFGMRVLAFALGFGKRLVGFQRGETDYRICALPLGGYVKLSGDEPDETSNDPRDFLNRPRWQRIAVYLAGPAMNAVLAVVLVTALFVVGIDVPALQSMPATVGAVDEGSPAALAGIAPGDEIVALGGQQVSRWQEVAFPVLTSIGRPLELEVERGGQRRKLTVTPIPIPGFELGTIGVFPKIVPKVGQVLPGTPAERAGLRRGDEMRAIDGRPLYSGEEFVTWIEARIGVVVVVELLRGGELLHLEVVPEDRDGKGKIGVLLSYEQRYPPLLALRESLRFNADIVRQSLAVIGKIFTREVSAKSALSGPLEIAAQSGAAARTGFKHLLYWISAISISIGLLNLFPIPILDGGQIVMLLVESALRRDLSMAIKVRVMQVGFALIVLLMVTVLYFDFSKMITRLLSAS